MLPLEKLDPTKSIFDLQVDLADMHVREWMQDPDNRAYLHERKQEYLHTKGFSKGRGNGSKGNIRAVYDLPQEAFFTLPPEIRDDPKELQKWVKTRHPYLMFSSL